MTLLACAATALQTTAVASGVVSLRDADRVIEYSDNKQWRSRMLARGFDPEPEAEGLLRFTHVAISGAVLSVAGVDPDTNPPEVKANPALHDSDLPLIVVQEIKAGPDLELSIRSLMRVEPPLLGDDWLVPKVRRAPGLLVRPDAIAKLPILRHEQMIIADRRRIIQSSRVVPPALLDMKVIQMVTRLHVAVPDDKAVTRETVAVLYIDELIDPAGSAEEIVGTGAIFGNAQQPGRRILGVTYRLFAENLDKTGSSIENGVSGSYSRETVRYGTLGLEASAVHSDQGPFAQNGDSDLLRITLSQTNFAISDEWLLDTNVGDFRAGANHLLNNSFRFHLPTSIVRGVGSTASNEKSSASFSAGQLGRFKGTGTHGFKAQDAWLMGVGGAIEPNESWKFASQAWVVLSDEEDLDSSQSIAGAVRYTTPNARHHYEGHGLVDSNGNTGFWMDGDNRLSRWRHRYGAYRFAPNLKWTDVGIVNDRQGAYWRTDLQSFRRSLSAGLEIDESNIEAAPELSGALTTRAFGGASWRLNRATRIGGFLSASRISASSGMPVTTSRTITADIFLDQTFAFGASRFRILASDTRSDAESSTDILASWDHDWAHKTPGQLRTTLSLKNDEEPDGDIRRLSTGVTYQRDLYADWSVSGSLFYSRDYETAVSGETDTANMTLGINWNPVSNWDVGLDLSYNNTEYIVATDSNTGIVDKRAFLTVRYSEATGSTARIIGDRHGKVGTGRVTGRVFYDDNRDGVWNPGEESPANIVIYLDGRFIRVTGTDGRFEFWPVSTGEHRIAIGIEDVALPWGLDDESPQTVQVKVRADSEVQFPLIRMDQ